MRTQLWLLLLCPCSVTAKVQVLAVFTFLGHSIDEAKLHGGKARYVVPGDDNLAQRLVDYSS